jgi:superfamily II DNA or RNA helicase
MENNIRIRGLTTPLRAEITAKLTVDNPEYVKRKSRRQRTWGCDPKLRLYSCEGPDLIVPRGFELELLTLESKGGHFNWADLRVAHNRVNFGRWIAPYQPSAVQVEAEEKCYRTSGCLVAPAGSGKTDMGLATAAANGQPTLWITHTKDLLEQTSKRAVKCFDGIGEVGKLAEGVTNWGSGKLIIATVQTLAANPKLIEQLNQFIGTVIVDECHHLPASCFLDVVGQLKAKYMLGLTATPDRKDGLECYMYAGIGPKLYEIDRTGLYTSGPVSYTHLTLPTN